MRLLIDTHALIWFISDSKELPTDIKTMIESPGNDCFVSIVSFWEMAIKHSLGKLHLQADLATIFKLIQESGFDILPITPSHVLASAALDFHHRDPFDRLIIGQAQTESLTLISKD